MISYKHVWEHHASGALVLGAFLIVRLREDRGWWGRWVGLGCVIALALPTPFVLIDSLDPRVWDPTPQWSPFWRFVLPACKAIPVLVLWLLAVVQSYREHDRSAPLVRPPADPSSSDDAGARDGAQQADRDARSGGSSATAGSDLQGQPAGQNDARDAIHVPLLMPVKVAA